MRKRRNRITVRLSDKELKQLNAILERLPYNRESFIRQVLIGADVYEKPPVDYGMLIREVRALENDVHQLLRKAEQIRFIDEVTVSDLYNAVLDMDQKISEAFCSKKSKIKWSELLEKEADE